MTDKFLELRLALREIAARWLPFAVQCGCLALALLLLSLSLSLHRAIGSRAPIAGAPCAGRYTRLSASLRSGDVVDTFTGPMARMLAEHVPGAVPVYHLGVAVTHDGVQVADSVAAFDSRLLHGLCVKPERGSLPDSTQGRQVLVAAGVASPGDTLQIGSQRVVVTGVTQRFRGLWPNRSPYRVFATPQLLARAGHDPAAVHMRAWYVLIRRGSGAIARADAMLRAYPASFPKATGFSATPSLHLGADTARTARLYQSILWIVALALLVFALANLGVYQGARGADFTLRVGILAENGTGRVRRMLYALAEPLLLTLLAVTVAVLATPVMEGVLVHIIDVAGMQPHLSVATVILVLAVALACAALLVTLRLGLHASASRGTVHALVQRLLDWLSTLQAVVALLLLGAMIAVCGAWYRVVPKQVGYSLDHVQVYVIHAPKGRHYPAMQGRMGPALAGLGRRIGGTAAVVENLRPIPGGGMDRITVSVGAGPRLPIYVNRVTPSYFSVLRMSPVVGRTLENRDVGSKGAPFGLGVVINRKAQALLGLRHDALGTLLEIRGWHSKGLLTSGVPVVGVVNEGSSGRDAGDNTLRPMLYMPYKGFNIFTTYILLTRYAQGMPLADVTRQVEATMAALTPGARVVTSRPAQAYFNAATALERAVATLFMLLGSGALVYVFLAINGVALLRLALDRHTLAIRHAIGETRQALVTSLLRRLAVPMLVGAAVGAVLVYVAVPLLGKFFSGGTITAWKVLALALLVFLLCVASALASGALRLWRAPLAEWLRNPD